MTTSGVNTEKIGWRPVEWARAVGISRVYVFRLIRDGRIDSVKLDKKTRIITTRPDAFLAQSSLTQP